LYREAGAKLRADTEEDVGNDTDVDSGAIAEEMRRCREAGKGNSTKMAWRDVKVLKAPAGSPDSSI
jgi:hypothetical protein